MALIGLTGSIASGKSAVSERLRGLGAFVTDADEISRELMCTASALVEDIGREFPGVVADGELSRAALAQRVFGNAEELKKLNALTHPAIIGRMHGLAREYLEQYPKGQAFLDMSLLIETGDYKNVDAVWLVTAPDALRLKRLMARDGCTEEHARKRMAAQMPQEEKMAYADVVIDNSYTLERLYERVDALYRELCARG